MSKLAYFTPALMVIPGPALAQIVFQDAPPVAPPTRAEKNQSDLDRIQCRMQDTTGTRLGRHQVCLTREQWLTYEAEEKDWIVHIQAQAGANSGG